MAEGIIKLARIQFQHLHLGVVLVPWSSLFTEFLCLVSHFLTISHFQKPCLSSQSQQQPTPVFLPGESNRQRNLASYSPWGSQRLRHYLAFSQIRALAKYIYLASRCTTSTLVHLQEHLWDEFCHSYASGQKCLYQSRTPENFHNEQLGNSEMHANTVFSWDSR